MEGTSHIRHGALEFSGWCFFRIIVHNFCYGYKNILHRLTKFQISFFQNGIRIVEGRALDSDQGYAVYQSIDKLIREGRRTVNDFPDFRNIVDACYFRNALLIFIACILPDYVHDVHGGRVQ